MGGSVTRFGRAEFDAARGRLVVGGRAVKLDRSSTAVLSALVDQAGSEVGKDRLLEAGWPGRLVHENSLAKAVNRLRRALGEESRALETVHGYGYRLSTEPHLVVTGEAGTGGVQAGGGARRRAAAAAVIGLAAATAAGLAAFGGDSRVATLSGLERGEPDNIVGRVLWVDDNPSNNAREKRFLEDRRIAVYQVASTDEALALLAMYEYRAVISDMNRNGKPLDGLELVREMRRRKDSTPFVLYTVVPSAAQRAMVAKAGGQGAAVKPSELYAAVLPLFSKKERRPAVHSGLTRVRMSSNYLPSAR